MKALFIFNHSPYGDESSYNGLRLAGTIAKQDGNEVKIFLIGDAASSAHRNQKVPSGFYNIEVMLGNVARHDCEIGVCGTCMDARGISDGDILDGGHRSTMAELVEWTGWADKVLVF